MRLDRDAPAAARGGEIVGREIGGQRLRTERLQERVRIRPAREQPAAEAARVVEAQAAAAREHQVDMVVGPVRGRIAKKLKAARHPEVHEQRASLRAEQEVLAAPLERIDPLSRELAREALRDGPAQARLPHLDGSDRAADHVRRQAAARRFDLGELRHRLSLRSRTAELPRGPDECDAAHGGASGDRLYCAPFGGRRGSGAGQATRATAVDFLNAHFYGLANLGFSGYVVVTLLWLHATMMAVTLYFHRDQAHRSIDLHPAVRHFCRFWLWMNTGASTREWVAVHRKHHAYCEQEGDPHSPRLFGLKKVLLEGSELYRASARDPETVEKYSKGCPNDWLERHVYQHRHGGYLGISLLAVTDLALFGVPAIIMAALQLSNMPFLAAGVINGLCHAKGYRNFETDDDSTNLWPVGLFIAGEELHNNHHAFPTSAKFSMRRHEVDMGWLHLKVLAALGLAKIRRVANPPELENTSRAMPEIDELRAIIVHRMHVLRHFTSNVTLPVLRRELESLGEKRNSLL